MRGKKEHGQGKRRGEGVPEEEEERVAHTQEQEEEEGSTIVTMSLILKQGQRNID